MADKSKSIMKKPEIIKSEAMDIDEIQSNESDGETGQLTEPVTIYNASHLAINKAYIFLNIYRTWHESWRRISSACTRVNYRQVSLKFLFNCLNFSSEL